MTITDNKKWLKMFYFKSKLLLIRTKKYLISSQTNLIRNCCRVLSWAGFLFQLFFFSLLFRWFFLLRIKMYSQPSLFEVFERKFAFYLNLTYVWSGLNSMQYVHTVKLDHNDHGYNEFTAITYKKLQTFLVPFGYFTT